MKTPPSLDPCFMLDSSKALLGVTFVKNNAFTYPPAVEAAKLAQCYREEAIGKSIVHYVLFGKSPDQAALALCVLGYATGWNSTQVYGGGQLIVNKHQIRTLLQCYLNATACSDPTAYCCVVKNGVILPCRQLELWFRYEPRHPSPGAGQFEAAAILRGVNWCPMLRISNFRAL